MALNPALGRAVLELTTDSVSFNKGLDDADKRVTGLKGNFDKTSRDFGRSLDSFSRQMSMVGKGLTVGLTIPLMAIGGAAILSAHDFEKAMATIRAGTGATGKDLAALGQSFRAVYRQVPNEVGAVATAIADLNTRTGATGPALEGMATQILHVSRMTKSEVAPLIAATTRLFGDWSVSTDKQSESLDYLWRVSQSTGIQFQQLSELVVQFGAPLRALGYDLEQGAALMGKWEKEGVNLETVLSGLRFALGNFAKAGKEPQQALQAVITEIQNAKTESEATAVAFATFGKRAAIDMSRAIIEGRFNIDQLVASLKTGSETITQAGEDTLTFSEKLTRLRHRVGDSLEPLGRTMLRVFDTRILPKLDAAAKKVDELARAFEALPSSAQTGIIAVAGLAAVLGPLALALAAIARAMKELLVFSAIKAMVFHLGEMVRLIQWGGWGGFVLILRNMWAALGLIGPAAAVVATAFASWKVGTWIGEMSGLTDWIGKKLAKAIWGVSEAEYDATRAAAQAGPAMAALANTGLKPVASHAQAAADGMNRAADGAKRQATAAKELTEAQKKLKATIDGLIGLDDIAKASEYAAAMAQIGDLARISPDQFAEMSRALVAAGAAYDRMGRSAQAAAMYMRAAAVEAAGFNRSGILGPGPWSVTANPPPFPFGTSIPVGFGSNARMSSTGWAPSRRRRRR